MEKFNYKKWVTENKYGKINEQTVSCPSGTLYNSGCDDPSVVNQVGGNMTDPYWINTCCTGSMTGGGPGGGSGSMSGSMSGPNYAGCGMGYTTSACAQQWFGPNAINFANFMGNKNCTNFQSTSNKLEQQAYTIMQGAPNPQQGPYNNWNDIKNAANASGLQQPQKGQFKRKAAKGRYALCMNQACGCSSLYVA